MDDFEIDMRTTFEEVLNTRGKNKIREHGTPHNHNGVLKTVAERLEIIYLFGVSHSL